MSFSWDKLGRSQHLYEDAEYPFVSIVIPTCNCAQTISTTLDHVLAQKYPSYEIIIVDHSTDRTLEIIKNYNNDKIKIYSTAHELRFEMINKGLSQAHGEYVNILFPGDFYIHNETLKEMMSLILQENKPELAYCGTLIREGRSEAKILFRPLNLNLLKRGQQPTSLQACWLRTECVRELGKFNASYSQRGGFDLMCRFMLNRNYRFVSLKRVLIDYDLRLVSRRMIIAHFYETMRTVYRYFGFADTLRWIYHQRDTRRFMKLWVRHVKFAFKGSTMLLV